jgi:hypothetical protein
LVPLVFLVALGLDGEHTLLSSHMRQPSSRRTR